ncbi:MAG: toxin VasX [Haemophilus parainfluenzae]|nr:toxin VasX [Haemophilus parainfluenzae]
MANNEQDYEPQAKPADEVTKQCQEFIRLYPTRWALTDSAFEKIKNTGTTPTYPKEIAEMNSDYDLRRLRDGYIYILATKAECQKFKITTEASNGEAWYIYDCNSDGDKQTFHKWSKNFFEQWVKEQSEKDTSEKDISQNDTSNKVKEDNSQQFEKNNNEELATREAPQQAEIPEVNVIGTRRTAFIELNRAIETAYIMYSEFKLPYELLQAIERDPLVKMFWMKKIPTNAPSGLTLDIKTTENIVNDFASITNYVRNYASNLYRSHPIGKLRAWKEQLQKITNSEGVVVALDDPIGIARDLDYYVYYLDDKRQEVLSKYEYAFITAQIIDAHVAQLQMAENSKRRRAVSQYVPYDKKMDMTIAGAYATLNIDDSHLNNSEDSIIEILKNELGITQTINGVNTINKIAKIPNLFNAHIDNVVHSICDHIAKNTHRIKNLFELYEKNKSEPMASLCCQYFEGLIGHLSYTSLGQQALITAFNSNNDVVTKTQKEILTKAAESLKNLLDSFKNFLSSLANMGNFYRFNLYSFDRIVQVISNEVVLAGSYRENGKRYYKRTEIIRNIEEVYRKTGVFGQEELLSEKKIFSHANKLKASRKKLTTEELIPVRTELPKGLKVDDSDFKRVTGLSSKLDGAAKLFAFSAILGFFTEDSSYTKEGRWANNAAFATLLAFTEKVAPNSELGFEFRQVAGQRMSLTAINNATGATFSSGWQAARAGLFNFGTALAGIGVLVEVANAHEAKYKGDEIDYWGAVSRGTGSALMALSPATLGTALTMMASTSANVALAGAALRIVAIALPYVGAILLLIGVGLALFKKSDMELWIKHSFWGDSDNYWGEAEDAYNWSESRPKDFKLDTFDKSKELVSNKNIYNYYKVEMQRLFSITEKIKFEVIDKHHILVTHPNINTLETAQKIRINYKSITIRRSPFLEVYSEPQIIFDENQSGQAILYFKDWSIRDSLSGNPLLVNANEIERLKLQVSIPRYNQATENITSDTTILDIKGK